MVWIDTELSETMDARNRVGYLTIRQRGRVVYERIVNEANREMVNELVNLPNTK